jgi:hypothetical protein
MRLLTRLLVLAVALVVPACGLIDAAGDPDQHDTVADDVG